MISVIYYFCFFFFILLYFPIFILVYLVTLPFDKERLVLHRASGFWGKGIYRMGIGWHTKVEGLENIDKSKPYVILVNHQSFLDIPLMYVIPLNFKWISKKEVYKMPIFGMVLYMHGDIAIERGSSDGLKKMIRQSVARLSRGTSVIIFPEGTRSRTGRINRFKPGAFSLAKSAGVDLLPVVADGNRNIMDGWKVRSPHTFTVRVLEPIKADYIASKDIKELAEEVHSIMEAAHRQIAPEVYENQK